MKINRATRIVVLCYGLIMVMAGVEHGIGEVLQGSGRPDSIVIKSWGDSELFSILSGEPAMTLIPDFLISGILTILVSLLIAVWFLFFLHRKDAGPVLLLLSIVLLLVGGGFGPPLLGIILGFSARKIRSGLPVLQRSMSTKVLKFTGMSWYFFLPAGLLCFLYMFPGSVILWGSSGFFDAKLMAIVSVLAFLFLFLSVFSALLFDAARRKETFEPEATEPHEQSQPKPS